MALIRKRVFLAVALLVVVCSWLGLRHRGRGSDRAHGLQQESQGEPGGPALDEKTEAANARPGSVDGIVIDSRGQPRDGAEVQVVALGLEGETGPARMVRTSRGGRFRFDALAPGSYLATARLDRLLGHAPATLVLRPAGELRDVVLELRAEGVTLSGHVSDEGGGSIAGAEVRAAGNSPDGVMAAFTDERGRYHLVLPAGSYVLAARADGYAPSERILSLGGDQILDFRLRPGAIVRGRVVARNGGAIPGAVVTLLTVHARGLPWRVTTAAADGGFELRDIAPGRYRLWANRGRWVGKSPKDLTVPLAGLVDGVTIELGQGLAIGGRVMGGSGTAAGAELRLRGPSGMRVAHAAADGGYRFEGLPRGRYAIAVTAPGFVPAGRTDLVLDDRDLDAIDLRLGEGAEILGRAVTPDGRPVEDATVIAAGSGGGGMAHSAVDGSFRLTGLRPGDVFLDGTQARHGHAHLPAMHVAAGERKQVTMTFEDDGSVAGRVRWNDGNPAASVYVSAVSAAGGKAVATTDRDGSYWLGPLGSGLVTVAVTRKPDRGFMLGGSTHNVTLAEHEHRTGVDLDLPRGGGRIHGVVLGPDGAPVAGAAVSVVEENAAGLAIRLPRTMGGPRGYTHTADDGTFSLDDLEQVRFTVFARAPGLAEASVAHVPADADGVQLQLRPGAQLAGRAVDGAGKPIVSYLVSAVPAGEAAALGPPPKRVRSASGDFALHGLAAGTYDIVVTAKAGQARLAGIAVAEGQAKSGLLVAVTPARSP